jgi:RNA polymerase sigma factor for flagellar operon FliA
MNVEQLETADDRPGLTLEERQRLVEEHLNLVHHVARTLTGAYLVDADYDELISAGTMGLIRAVECYDPRMGVKLSTFAIPRIRGAIQDEFRRMDPVPRTLRKRARDLAKAREDLAKVYGRPAEREEIAAHLAVDVETLHRWEAEVEAAAQLSLSDSQHDPAGRALPLADLLAGETAHDIEERINASEEARHLREAIRQLKPKERTVLALYFFEELKLSEIATVLEVTESRVSQIRTQALAKLRQALAPLRSSAA